MSRFAWTAEGSVDGPRLGLNPVHPLWTVGLVGLATTGTIAQRRTWTLRRLHPALEN